MAKFMRRSEILRAYALTVESRAQGIARWDSLAPEKRLTADGKPWLRPVPLRPLKPRALDDLIRAAKDRMVASVLPQKAEETRATLVEYQKQTLKRMASDDSAASAQAGTQAAMAIAKMMGLIVDKVEAKNENRYPDLGDAERGALARFLESIPGAPRNPG